MPDSDLTYETTDIVASPAAAAETVVALLSGVNTRWQNQQIKLSGWVNVTPDASATAVVLRVRRHALGGALVGLAQTMGLGASAGGTVLGNFSTDVVSNDAPTAVACDGNPHTAACLIAAPPAWMNNAGQIILAGLYVVTAAIDRTAGPTVPGVNVRASGPFLAADIAPFDGIQALGQVVLGDIQALATADLPYTASWSVAGTNDATATLSVSVGVTRLASDAAASGALITPADAVTDVVDSPGSLASGSYVLTAQMTGAAAPSTINGVRLEARVD